MWRDAREEAMFIRSREWNPAPTQDASNGKRALKGRWLFLQLQETSSQSQSSRLSGKK
jgi:hypothetical protein